MTFPVFRFILTSGFSENVLIYFVSLPRKDYKGMGRIRKVLPFYLYHLYLYGQWTVMDSSFLKSLTGTTRACGTRDKFPDFTVHYCPLSRYKRNTNGWGWVEDVSQNIHAYRVRAVRIIVFNFILHPPPPCSRANKSPTVRLVVKICVFSATLHLFLVFICIFATTKTMFSDLKCFLYMFNK